jgi:simple sugar transport system ATP-binding protein
VTESTPASNTPSAGGVTADTPPRIALRGIRKSFGTIDALRGVDLDLAPREILGLVGDNAAGKSTLSKIMSGAEVPDSGEIRVDGELVQFRSPADAQQKHIEMAYQDLSLCDTIDVAGNLYLGREPRRRLLGVVPFIDRNKMHADAANALRDLEIKVSNTRLPVANLSGGQRQSIAIGRAVTFDPRVLILDEPTSALAVAEVEAVLRLIKRVAARGVSVILITHRLQDIFRVCDRVMVMYEGTNVAERAIEETDLDDLVKLIVGGEAANARVEA